MWAAGAMYRLNSAREIIDTRILVAHWNGTKWSQDSTVPVKGGFSELDGISTLPNGDAWAVGSYEKGATAKTKRVEPLIEHYAHC